MTSALRTNQILRTLIFCSAIIAGGLILFSPVTSLEASSTPTLILTVNGGESAAIVNGQSVTLEWYVDGPVNSCSINNGVGVIDVSEKPASGSMTVTPPENTSTSYTLNCEGFTDSATVDIKPIVTMTLPQGSPRTNDPTTGSLDRVDVNWDSQFATECSNVWRVKASDPDQTKIWANHSAEYVNKNQPNGRIRYRGWPHGSISETTTFYIKCMNVTNGSESIGSVTLIVNDPPPPDPPTMNLWTNTPLVERSELYGYASADIRFNTQNVSWCNYRAYYEDGTQYSSLPPGFGKWGGHTSGSFTNVRIATTTLFEVGCSRGAVTIDGVEYPATSTTKTVLVTVGGGDMEVDRTTLPPVTVTATATPNPTVKNAITNRANTAVNLTVANADYCYLRAYDSVGSAYNLSNWTRTASWNRIGNGPKEYAISIATTTRLQIDCRREYDRNFFDPGDPEYENGNQVFNLWVVADEPLVAAAAPAVYMYGNAVRYDVDQLWSLATERIGFNSRTGNPRYAQNTSSDASYSRISFPFEHPYGGSDTYNIHLRVCDENDGESTFRISTAGAGEVGTITTNDIASQSDLCDSSTVNTQLVAASVNLTDGEIVTIECETPADGERCRFHNIYFGAGNGGVVNATPDEDLGFANVPLMWISERATRCDSLGAVTQGGSTYEWYYGSNMEGLVNRQLATTTTFSIECSRPSDSLVGQSSVTIAYPQNTSLVAETSVLSGECIDDGTFGNLGQTIDAPDGYIANTTPGPNFGYCVPAVDLSAVSPSVNISGPGVVTDNVNGTYDGINILVAIENLGPGALPANSNISYSAQLGFPQFALPTSTSPIGFYNGDIAAPSPNPNQSPALSRTMNSVPFGTHLACARVNLDNSPNNYPEASTDFDNNISCTNVSLPVPPPPMTFSADRIVIRSEQTVTLDWSINVSYQMACTVRGPGGLNQTFDTLAEGHPFSNSYTTNPLTSTSEFIFQCTEPITNTTFTERVNVEVVPEFEEI